MNTIINVGEQSNIYNIYVSSFNNKEREAKMIDRFNTVGVGAYIYSNVVDDDRVQQIMDGGGDPSIKRTYGSFYSILGMIEDFYASDKEYGVFLENDVYLHKNLKDELTYACQQLTTLNLDILLVGYLLHTTPENYGCTLAHDDGRYKFYQYEDNLWGSHGFILNKKQAKYFKDKYTVAYALDPSRVEIMCSDWVFTKEAKNNRMFLWPPLIIEEGLVETDNEGQIRFHRECKDYLYNDNYTT